MEQIVNILKELPTLTEGVISSSPTTTTAEDSEVTSAGLENGKKKRKNQPGEVRLCGDMYEQWPTLEFSDLNSSILDLFTK
ncbi:hypothetical protein B9Z55_004946 [Caenorhabditis nigoni]|uniref:Uncharacterized protein n=1 Tax=Caenorhabditis nigoni TaxID=1611254 RepID=A0A2G5UZF0_9PELO|nr:hypothetical protein B9Z55_004946 [Caenorhabditis nigoni]